MFFILTAEVTPSPCCSQPPLKHRPQPGADPAWQFNVFWNTPVLMKFPTLWDVVQPCSWKSAWCCSTWPWLLQNTPMVACVPYVLALLSAAEVLDVQDSPQHSSPATPRALMARQLKTASKKLNWELKGYTTGFSADVQTLSIILPVLCRKNAPTFRTGPKRKRLHYSHLAGSTWRSWGILSPAQGSFFSIMHLMSHFPWFPAEKVHRNPRAHTQIP